MSGIAVAFHRDGSPVGLEQMVRMTDCIAHRGPDGIGHWVNGPVGLGHCALHTLPEDVGQTQPIHTGASQLHLTFDGRIDNRDDLLPLLKLEKEASDARVVLAAYEKWGEFCPERLLGDFAFAIWDEGRKQLFCARDILGVCPFYYSLGSGTFLAASERSSLFTHRSVSSTANEPVIAALLYITHISQEETIHRDVMRLAPASCMTVTADSIRKRRYWAIQEVKPVRCRTDEEYANRLWEILREATRARCRVQGGVGILMSGGLDSTAVAAAACEMQHEGLCANSRIESYSQVFPGWSEADESDYIRKTADYLNLPSHCFSSHFRRPGGYESVLLSARDLADYPNDAFWDDLRTFAAGQGTRVLLTGMGGDDWLTGSFYQAADSLRQGRIPAAFATARHASAHQKISLKKSLWIYALRPLAPRTAVRMVRAYRPLTLACPAWIPKTLTDRTNLLERLHAAALPVEDRPRSALHYFIAGYERGEHSYCMEAHGRLNSRFGVETRHPFHDQRLIEFAHGIPDELKLRGPVRKHVLRKAISDRVPEEVRLRRDKSDFTRLVSLELKNQCPPEFFRKMSIADRGWVDGGEIQKVWERLLDATSSGGYLQDRAPWSLWRAFALEHLVRNELL